MFSGGLDSSFILSTLLTYTDVHLMYVKGIQGEHKTKKELSCREDIKAFMHDFRPDHGILSDSIIEIPYNTLTQASQWLIGAADRFNGVDSNLHSKLIAGYVMGDSIGHILDNMKAFWKNLQTLQGVHETVPLSTPLIDAFIGKQFILGHTHMPDELLKLIWVCETPKVGKKEAWFEDKDWYTDHLTPCGKCDACKRLIAEMAIKGRPIPSGSNIPDPRTMDMKWEGTNNTTKIWTLCDEQ